jgi:hypothetical protein
MQDVRAKAGGGTRDKDPAVSDARIRQHAWVWYHAKQRRQAMVTIAVEVLPAWANSMTRRARGSDPAAGLGVTSQGGVPL